MACGHSMESAIRDKLHQVCWFAIYVQAGNTHCLASRQIAVLIYHFKNAVNHDSVCSSC